MHYIAPILRMTGTHFISHFITFLCNLLLIKSFIIFVSANAVLTRVPYSYRGGLVYYLVSVSIAFHTAKNSLWLFYLFIVPTADILLYYMAREYMHNHSLALLITIKIVSNKFVKYDMNNKP